MYTLGTKSHKLLDTTAQTLGQFQRTAGSLLHLLVFAPFCTTKTTIYGPLRTFGSANLWFDGIYRVKNRRLGDF
jgi:hypothetical protein